MDVEVVREAAVVKEVSGDVVAVKPDGSARKLALGDTVVSGELVIVADKSSILVETPNAAVSLDANTVATESDVHGWGVSPVAGEVEFDLAQLGEGAIDEDELTAIQDAILAGADPTELLEATAAGAGASGSANGGFVTIEYNGAEVLASTFFETSGFETTSVEQADEDIPPIVFADGGQDISLSLVENVLGDSENTQTSVTVFAASLALDPETFVPEPLSLASLLSELNSDITSNGNPVVFTYDAATNAIVGRDGSGADVLTIDIDTINIGNDVSLTLATTIVQPIDHSPSVGGGQVAFSGDKVTVSFDIIGTDIGGNPIQAPINAQVAIGDGADPIIANISESSVYEAGLDGASKVGSLDTTASGQITVVNGSDVVTALKVDVDEFNGRDIAQGLFSGGQRVVLEETSEGVYRGYITVNENGVDTQIDVLSVTVDQTNLGSYSVALLQELDHSTQGQDTLKVNLPIYAVDADNDESARSNLVINVGDDIQVVADGNIEVVESTIGQPNESAEIDVITQAGADEGQVTSFTFDGKTYTLQDGQTEYSVTDSHSVVVGTVNITPDGKLSFTSESGLDHSSSETLQHTIVVTVTDRDNDVLTSTVELAIKDGQDPVITNITAATVYESGLTDGSNVDPSVTAFTGQLTGDVGSDTVTGVQIDLDAFKTAQDNAPITSQGKPILLEAVTGEPGVYRGYVELDNGTRVDVLKVTLGAVSMSGGTFSSNYTVELLEAIDHPTQGGAADSDFISISLPIVATDADTDKSVPSNLVINVGDDIQVVADGNIDVVESTIGQPNESVEIDVITQAGADEGQVTSFTFDGKTYTLQEGQSEYSVTDSHSVVVGTVNITPDGKLSFTPESGLDHSSSETLQHTIVVTVTDRDNDVLTSTVELAIKDGQDPVITNITAATVYESGLTDGSNVAPSVTAFIGQLTGDVGSDTVTGVQIDLDAFKTAQDNAPITSQGKPILLEAVTGEPGVYRGYVELDNGTRVDVLKVTLGAVSMSGGTFSSNYTVELLEAIDHPTQGGAADSDFISISLPIVATDADTDKSVPSNLVINVGDDIQVVANGNIEMVESTIGQPNESAEIDVITQAGADEGQVTSFTFDGKTYTLQDGQTEYSVTDSHSVVVGTVNITPDGKLSFTPESGLDHSSSETLQHTIVVTVTDRDNDVLTSTVELAIKDGQDPVITNITAATMYESGLTDGSNVDPSVTSFTGQLTGDVGSDAVTGVQIDLDAFKTAQDNAPITSQGKPILLEAVSGEPGVYRGYVELDNGTRVDVLKVTLGAVSMSGGSFSSNYTVELLEAIDHPTQGGAADNDFISISLPIVATDADTDKSTSSNLVINVGDDIQVVADGNIDVVESTIGQPNESAEIDVITQAGADEGQVTSFTFDGKTYTLQDGQTEYSVTDSHSVVVGKVNITPDGKLSFTPESGLDHTSSETLQHTIVVTVTDRDNDVLTSTVELAIKDGQDPVITNITAATVYESGLTDGSNVDPTVTAFTGQLTGDVGSDAVTGVQIDLDAFKTAQDNSPITSQGKPILLEAVSGETGVYRGYVELDNGTRVDVLKVTLGAVSMSGGTYSSSYKVELLEAIDHPTQGGAADNDFISISLPIVATDADTDKSVPSNLVINVGDDTATIDGFALDSKFSVNEDDIASGTSPGDATASGKFLTTEGADSVVRYELINVSNSENGLKSGGDDIAIIKTTGASGSTIYTGKAGGDVIFTLELKADGSYTYTQEKAIDHAQGSDSLSIPFDVVAIDRDGDVSPSVRLAIGVNDDKPILTGVTGESRVDEDDLSGIGSDQTQDTEIKGNFTIEEGADGVVKYELVDADDSLAGITSGGEGLVWAPVSTSGTTATYTAQTVSGVSVFTIKFNAADNSYTFELLKPLDHPDGGLDNILQIDFQVKATDFDNDESNVMSLPIRVVDDVPTLVGQSITRVEGQNYNNSKVDMFADELDKGADGASLTKLESADPSITFGGRQTAYVDLKDGTQNIKVFEQLDGEPKPRQLGVLRVNSNGEIEFKALNNLDHDGDEIKFTVNVIATDGDKDTSTAPLDIIITDKEAKAIPLKVITFEDAGRALSNQYETGKAPERENALDNQDHLPDSPAKVALSVNLFDQDNGEDIGQLTIKGSDHNGTFYYKVGDVFYELTANASGDIVLDGSLLKQVFTQNGINTIATIDNLYFVPDRNESTGNGGFNVNYQLQIDNNGSFDHNIDSSFKIEVESVADIATWLDGNQYKYETVEDGSNVRLSLGADTQDTSRDEIITYELKPTQGMGNFELLIGDRVLVLQDGVYKLTASEMKRVEVNPNDNFSGQIHLQATAISTERSNAYKEGVIDKSSARSEPKDIVIDVKADADMGSFSVKRVQINEDNIDDPNGDVTPSNRDPLTLDEVINMKPSEDSDKSETLHVRISGLTEGAELVWVGNAPSQITHGVTAEGTPYQEIPYDQLVNVEVVPDLHSNEDFKFDVTGVVKDTAALSGGVTQVSEAIIGTKTVNVEVKGVADVPKNNTTGSGDWTEITDGSAIGVETTIKENGYAQLQFSVESGEHELRQNDHSESVTVLLSNIPDGVVIEDSKGNEVNLNFAGYENNDPSKPIYEANITNQGAGINSGIIIRPVSSSTENIHIKETIVVTENDGHSRSFEREIRIKVEPIIDTTNNYTNTSVGDEDSPIDIKWYPRLDQDYSDKDEHVTSIVIEGIPDGAQVNVAGGVVWNFDSTTGELTISPASGQATEKFTEIALQQGFIQITPPKDSSTNFDLKTTIEVEEINHEHATGNPTDEIASVKQTLEGTITVKVNPVVEAEDADNKLVLTEESGAPVAGALKADASGEIRFTANSDNQALLKDANGNLILDVNGDPQLAWTGEYVIKYLETDATDSQYESDELVTRLVVQFDTKDEVVLDQLFVQGAVYEGEGRWVVTDKDAFSIKAPNGLDIPGSSSSVNNIGLTIFAEVVDTGDDGSKQSVAVLRQTDVTLQFPEHIDGNGSKAGVVDVVDNTVIIGNEDTSIDLGTQLKSAITVVSHDHVEDTVTIVIGNSVKVDTPDGEKVFSIAIGGSNVDFTNGQYVFKATLAADGSITGLDGLTLTPPKDYSGDFKLPITVITTDTGSGDELSRQEEVVVKVAPIADVKGGSMSEPGISLDEVGTVNADGSTGKEAFEDSLIRIDLGYEIGDKVSGIEGGEELLSSITLTLADTAIGEFYDSSGKALGTSISFNEKQIADGALDNVLFKPDANYPTSNDDNKVVINVTGAVKDTATFNLVGGTASHLDTFSTSVSFDVTPVVDDVVVTGPGGDPNDTTKPIIVSGNEDEVISLANSGPVAISLTDTDGSESFVSIKFTGVPDGFLLSADPNSGYTVKNNGGNEWSVKLPAGTGDSIDLSAISVQPPKHFSGTAEFGVAVYTQESLLGVPTAAQNLPKFVLNVTPVGDIVDTDVVDSVTGSEGINVDIAINASVIDKALSASGTGIFSENAPETIRVEVSNVPQGAKIYYPDGTTIADYDPATKVWTLDIAAQSVDKIVFNSGQHNSEAGNIQGIDGPIHIDIMALDNGVVGPKATSATGTGFDVDLVIDPINDQPTFVGVVNLDTSEDVLGGLAIDQFSIADIDAAYDDPNATYTLTLVVDKGWLEFVNDPNVSFVLQPDGSLVVSGKLADINASLSAGNVIFKPDVDCNDINTGGPVTVTATVDDGGNNGAINPSDSGTSSTNQTTFLINVAEVNDAPQPQNLSFNAIAEEGTFVISQQDLIDATSDKEGDTISVVKVEIVEGQGTLTQQGASWVFEAAKDYNGPVRFRYEVKDDGTTNGQADHLTASAEINFVVEPVNDKPVLDIDGITTAIDEASGQQISGISVSDVDYVGASANDLMTVTLNVDYGVLSIVLPVGSSINATGEGSDTLTLSGTLTDLNALLDNPTSTTGVFIDASHAPTASIRLNVTAKDSWNSSGIALEADPKHYDIAINPVANVPTLSLNPKFSYTKNITASHNASVSGIAVLGVMAALTDQSEALTLEIHNVPTGATLESSTGSVSLSGDVWVAAPEAMNSLVVKGATVGDHTLQIKAVSEELDAHGVSVDRAESIDSIDVHLHVVSDATVIDKSSETEAVHLDGQGANAELTGGSGNDLLEGGVGHDVLVGGAGDDTLLGGEGNDTLEGGLGSDILVGGTGMDTFVWREIDDGSMDTIKDFSVSEGDKIDLRAVLPELKQNALDMDKLLDHLDVKVDGNDVELHVHPGGEGTQDQGILVENLVQQLDSGFSGMSHEDMVSSLLQHVMLHDNN
ncbi:calcium-binding protein [Vibrio tubiashii]|nr:calcium-binding protein [Vibrio tubiashii]